MLRCEQRLYCVGIGLDTRNKNVPQRTSQLEELIYICMLCVQTSTVWSCCLPGNSMCSGVSFIERLLKPCSFTSLHAYAPASLEKQTGECKDDDFSLVLQHTLSGGYGRQEGEMRKSFAM